MYNSHMKNLDKLRYEGDRPYRMKRIKVHSNGKPYVRREYGRIITCPTCGDRSFTTKKEVTFCSVSCSKKGALNPNWLGGKKKQGGYIFILTDEGYRPEHRLVMEESLGRKLDPFEIVHHRNAIKDDNRLENLEIILNYPSDGLHVGKLRCPHCNEEFGIR